MNISWTKVGFASVGATCLSISMMTQLANAASFEFVFQNHNAPLEKGTLSFSQSPLTGIGLETVNYSQLTDAFFEYYFFSNLAPGVIYSGAAEPSFTFNNGNLIGMNFESSTGVDFTTTGGSTFYSIKGTGKLKVSGNNYQEFFTGIESDGGGYIKESNNALVSSGNMTYTTLVPVKPVPEPLTMLGAATALSFGTLFKKSLSGKSKKSE